MKNLKTNLKKLGRDTDSILTEIKKMPINQEDFDLVRNILNDLLYCYGRKVESYSGGDINDNRNRLSERDKFDNHDFIPEQIPEPRMSDCIKGIRQGTLGGLPINLFPSSTKGPCRRQCVVLSTGDWEFGDTKLRNDILSYWYRCFYKNRFTIIFTQSWQNASWNKWKTLIDSYVADQTFEINGDSQKVDHTVIIIEYSEEAMILRYNKPN
ncbi:hypothetical protein OAN33_05480 [Flavobacteriales bacterium]|nr:hypothetical protein [Flavobacteriales bacterium]